jgi:hypothetical protein
MTVLQLAKPPTPEETSAERVKQILTKALGEGLVNVTLIGSYADGSTYLTSSQDYGPDMLWELKVAERILMDTAGGEE